MKDFDKALADSNHQRQMRADRKRREFWNDVEFYITELFWGLLAIASIVALTYWVITS